MCHYLSDSRPKYEIFQVLIPKFDLTHPSVKWQARQQCSTLRYWNKILPTDQPNYNWGSDSHPHSTKDSTVVSLSLLDQTSPKSNKKIGLCLHMTYWPVMNMKKFRGSSCSRGKSVLCVNLLHMWKIGVLKEARIEEKTKMSKILDVLSRNYFWRP